MVGAGEDGVEWEGGGGGGGGCGGGEEGEKFHAGTLLFLYSR